MYVTKLRMYDRIEYDVPILLEVFIFKIFFHRFFSDYSALVYDARMKYKHLRYTKMLMNTKIIKFLKNKECATQGMLKKCIRA